MNIKKRIVKLEFKENKVNGWYIFYLKNREDVIEGRNRAGIPKEAKNIIAVRGGFPQDAGAPPFIYL